MDKKTPARKKAERMETERLSPLGSAVADYAEERRSTGKNIVHTVPLLVGAGVADLAARPFKKERSEEDMSELTREVARGNKMAKGGMTASSRADGIAQRGKTRGKVC